LDKRDSYEPNPSIEVSEELKDVALHPWNFQTFPGSRPTSWPLNLPSFLEKIKDTSKLDLFKEPIEHLTESKDFYELAKNFIAETCKEAETCQNEIKLKELNEQLA